MENLPQLRAILRVRRLAQRNVEFSGELLNQICIVCLHSGITVYLHFHYPLLSPVTVFFEASDLKPVKRLFRSVLRHYMRFFTYKSIVLLINGSFNVSPDHHNVKYERP